VDVTLLGTGAPAGFPEPGCPCASCARAAADGPARAATSVLVDGSLLLDLIPGAVLAAARAGQSLHRVQQVLLTHPHDGPAVEFPAELPPPVRVPDGRELSLLSGHRVRAIALDSPGTGYAVTGPDGQRLLYLPPGGAPAGLGDGGPRYDLCLLDVLGRPEALARLRAAGAAGWDTDVVAVHLGHTVPPGAEQARRLGAAGARAVPDGSTLWAGEPPEPPELPRRTLLLGGPRAGQSLEAERQLAAFPEVLCVVPETAAADHHPPGWASTGAAGLLRLLADDGPPLLVDSLPHWLAGAKPSAWDGPADPVAELAAAIRHTSRMAVLVSEDRPELVRLNTAVAAECEQVLLVVAGTVLTLRG
jgi:adenosylcobinamide kinase/adenosylcobinamide-phosphate guanylyltransferase